MSRGNPLLSAWRRTRIERHQKPATCADEVQVEYGPIELSSGELELGIQQKVLRREDVEVDAQAVLEGGAGLLVGLVGSPHLVLKFLYALAGRDEIVVG